MSDEPHIGLRIYEAVSWIIAGLMVIGLAFKVHGNQDVFVAASTAASVLAVCQIVGLLLVFFYEVNIKSKK